MSFKKDTTKHDIWTPFNMLGIYQSSNGHTCDDHVECGKSLLKDDIVRIKSVIIKNGKLSKV